MFFKIGLIFLFTSLSTLVYSKNSMNDHLKKITLAGGCFWCMEPPFESLPGVHDVVSGYSGGKETNPTYSEVSSGRTSHIESVQITYDPKKISLSHILDIFWRNIDPTQDNGQFYDIGPQYRTVIFYRDLEQQKVAKESKEALTKSKVFKNPIVTSILPFHQFYLAEDYHQDYYKKNPIRYKFYRSGSGRDRFLSRTWSKVKTKVGQMCNTSDKSPVCTKTSSRKPSSLKTIDEAYDHFSRFKKPQLDQIKSQLTPSQFNITQKDGTESPFVNDYWNNKRKGIYVDVVSGEPLFSSKDKYKSGTGWPSFTKPIDPRFVLEKNDYTLFVKRTEVRSKFGDSHLGHVFKDGPLPTGLRYCINSAALRFIPYEDLKVEGYGFLTSLFK